MSIRDIVRNTLVTAVTNINKQLETADTVIGEDMHELAREGKIILDLSNQTLDPLVEAMYDWRAFSWRVSRAVQYGPSYARAPDARVIRRKLAQLNH